LSFANTEFELFLESVDWDGPLRAWEYSRELRLVTSRLASVRLHNCYAFAREELVREIQEYFDAANDILPSKIHFDNEDFGSSLDRPPSTLILEIQEQSMFDSSDKFELLKEYTPSLAVVSTAFLCYRSFVTGVLGSSTTFARQGKLLCAGLAFAGCGMFLLKLADMRNSIKQKVANKMHEYFQQTSFLKSNVDYLTNASKKLMRTKLSDLARSFNSVLAEKEVAVHKQSQEKEELTCTVQFLDNVKFKSTHLLKEFQKIDLNGIKS
jgi:hypothetical protein